MIVNKTPIAAPKHQLYVRFFSNLVQSLFILAMHHPHLTGFSLSSGLHCIEMHPLQNDTYVLKFSANKPVV